MAKYIDLDAAIALAKDIIVPIKSGYYYRHRCIDPQELAELPAADVVERKAGRWCADYDYAEYDFDGSTPLPEPQKFQDGWQCSLCGVYSLSETNYCPNCGADMRGEQNGH